MPLLRQGGASAVNVVDNVQETLPELAGKLPDKMEDVNVEVAFDQSQYVRDALDNLRLEARARRRAGVAGGAAVPGESAHAPGSWRCRSRSRSWPPSRAFTSLATR